MLLSTSGQDFEGKEYFVTDGVNNPLGMFLGVVEDGGRLYQRVFSPFTVSPVSYMTTYRKTDRTHDYTAEKLGDKKPLKPEAVRVLTDDDYPWNSFWSNSLDFKVVTLEDYEAAQAPANSSIEPEVEDDLPF